MEQTNPDNADPVRNETSIDTQLEVDLISGGVGFDDGPADGQWLEEVRKKQKAQKTAESKN